MFEIGFNPFVQVNSSNSENCRKELRISTLSFNPFVQVNSSNILVFCRITPEILPVLIPLFRSIVQILPIAILCFIIIKNKEFAMQTYFFIQDTKFIQKSHILYYNPL